MNMSRFGHLASQTMVYIQGDQIKMTKEEVIFSNVAGQMNKGKKSIREELYTLYMLCKVLYDFRLEILM